MTHGAVQTTSSEALRISQSVQTWLSPGEPAKGPATMWTSKGLICWPSSAGSVITGVETVETDERA